MKVKILLFLLGFVWLSHFIQVFVPETGFDAVWYHLPVMVKVFSAGHLVFDPFLLQTVNPLLSDLFLGLGLFLGGEVGAKLVAYGFAAMLALLSYCLARRFLPADWSLLSVLAISLMQVVSWQASSAYVDVAKAMWETASLLLIFAAIDKSKSLHINYAQLIALLVMGAGAVFGASLASKHFSWLLVPGYLMTVYFIRRRWLDLFYFLIPAVIVPLPFLVHSFQSTGNPFYMVTDHLGSIGQIGGEQSIWRQVVVKTVTLPFSFWVIVWARDYVSPLVVLTVPLAVVALRDWKNRRLELRLFWLLISQQWLLWWFVPPLSTRYALAGFVWLLVALIIELERLSRQKSTWKNLIFYGCLVVTMMLLLPRLYVNVRSARYLLGWQTKRQYIEQFYDGNSDGVLKRWHRLP